MPPCSFLTLNFIFCLCNIGCVLSFILCFVTGLWLYLFFLSITYCSNAFMVHQLVILILFVLLALILDLQLALYCALFVLSFVNVPMFWMLSNAILYLFFFNLICSVPACPCPCLFFFLIALFFLALFSRFSPLVCLYRTLSWSSKGFHKKTTWIYCSYSYLIRSDICSYVLIG